MQWSTFYGIPSAIGISASWDFFTFDVADYRTLLLDLCALMELLSGCGFQEFGGSLLRSRYDKEHGLMGSFSGPMFRETHFTG